MQLIALVLLALLLPPIWGWLVYAGWRRIGLGNGAVSRDDRSHLPGRPVDYQI